MRMCIMEVPPRAWIWSPDNPLNLATRHHQTERYAFVSLIFETLTLTSINISLCFCTQPICLTELMITAMLYCITTILQPSVLT